MRKFYSLILLTVILLLSNEIKAQVNIQDSLALVDLYNSTNGPNWHNHTNWLTGAPVSKWHGVTVTAHRVSELSLTKNSLKGSIPESFGNLTNLQQIFLDDNKLSGSIPSSFGNLINLTTVYLGDNQLTGKIPSSISKLANLELLELDINKLSGTISSAFSKLGKLNYFSANSNKLTGDISMLAKLDSLQYLSLSGNRLSGSIPVFNSVKLGYFDLSLNQFTGNIPQFRKCEMLSAIDLSRNALTGPVQHQFDSLPNPNLNIYISDNRLSGNLPSFDKFTHLNLLDFSFNNFSGAIPALDSLKSLRYLYLSNNKLSGSIPVSVNAVHNLQLLKLSNNQLSNRIPDLDSLKNLSTIDFSHNQLNGSIPSSISSLYNFAEINLAGNHLSGPVPLLRFNNQFLNSLYLDSNEFTFAGMQRIATDYPFAVYAPQANINIKQSGNLLAVSAGGTLADNTYNWHKNGVLFKTKTGNAVLTVNANGNYSVTVTNSIATQLTLYSDTVAVTNLLQSSDALIETIKNNLSIYPNPVKTTATISFNASGNCTIKLTDVSGNLLQTKTVAGKGANTLQLDVSKYAAGMYFVSIIIDGKQSQTFPLNKE